MKKILSLTIAAILAITALSGCGKKEEEDNAVVTMYMPKAIDSVASYDAVMAKVNEMIQEKLGCTLDLKLIDMGNYAEKINVLVSSGEPMDLFYLSDNTTYLNYIRQDSVLQLDSLLKKYGKAILEKVDDAAWDMVRYKGDIYAVKNNGTYSVANSIVFKKDLVEKYGFDYKNVNSLQAMEPYLKTIKENEPKVYPYAGQSGKTSQRYVTLTDGIVFDNDNEEYIAILDCEDAVSDYKIKADYYQKGYIPKDIISKDDLKGEMKAGKYAILDSPGYYTEDGSKSTSYYGFPCVETYTGNTIISSANGARMCISSSSTHPEKAIQVLNLIWEDPEISNTLAYGIEGTDYVIDEERTAEIGSKSVIPRSGSEQTWAIWHNWIGPLWDQWDSPWNRVEALERMKEMNKDAIIAKCFGFNFDNTPVKAEEARCSAIYEECRRVFNYGCMDNFEQYLEATRKKYKDAGIDKVVEEINRQYKEWKNN